MVESLKATEYPVSVCYAYVNTNLLDLRGEPAFGSERYSQLYFGDTVQVVEAQSTFVKVRQADDYTGWVDVRFLTKLTSTQALAFRKKLNAVVSVTQTPLLDLKTHQALPPHFLYYGTPVSLRSTRGQFAVIATPDLKRFLVRQNSLKPIDPKRVKEPAGSALVREAKRFLGVPYLWGGISPAGFDCSGLVRTVCARFGIYLPRDTKDQIATGRHIERLDVRTGDLLFFKRHVGFAIGKDRIIHASRGGGGVRINSLVAGSEDYRPDLDRDFQEARRILT